MREAPRALWRVPGGPPEGAGRHILTGRCPVGSLPGVSVTDTQEPIMQTTFSCAINARDFSTSVTDTLRDEWTAGKMRHVAHALNCQHVAVEVDKGTGHTLVNAVILSVVPNRGGYPGHSVVIATEVGNSDKRTMHDLRKVGTIIPLGDRITDTPAKWRALQSYRDEASAAIAHVRPACEAEGMNYGKWTAISGAASVFVSYEPQREGAGTRWSKAVSLGHLKGSS